MLSARAAPRQLRVLVAAQWAAAVRATRSPPPFARDDAARLLSEPDWCAAREAHTHTNTFTHTRARRSDGDAQAAWRAAHAALLSMLLATTGDAAAAAAALPALKL